MTDEEAQREIKRLLGLEDTGIYYVSASGIYQVSGDLYAADGQGTTVLRLEKGDQVKLGPQGVIWRVGI